MEDEGRPETGALLLCQEMKRLTGRPNLLQLTARTLVQPLAPLEKSGFLQRFQRFEMELDSSVLPVLLAIIVPLSSYTAVVTHYEDDP